MGRSREVRYTIEIRCTDQFRYTAQEWRVGARYGIPGDGRPTLANVDRWVRGFEASRQAGQPNAHLGLALVVRAVVVDQKTKQDLVIWDRAERFQDEPAFQAVA